MRPAFQQKNKSKYIFGRFIRESSVVVIDQNNDNLGLIETKRALAMAHEAGLELVLVAMGKDGKPSTCKILDFGKFKYDQERKERAAKKKQRENSIKIKEVKFRPSTGDNDLQVKANQFKEFLDEGNRLKVTVMFRGREMTHQELGMETINKFIALTATKLEQSPVLAGRNLTAFIIRSKD